MSWLFGLLSNRIDAEERSRLGQIHPSAIHRVEKSHLYLVAGGIAETCLAGSFVDGQEESGWMMVGLPIVREAASVRFATASELGSRLAGSSPELDDLDGHYIALKWTPATVACWTDPLGLRTLYALESDRGTYISTRLDWLARAVGGLEVDLPAFGSHWLAVNQFSYRSLVRGVTRLTPGGGMNCTSNGIRMTSNPWTPSFSDRSPGEVLDIAGVLGPYVTPRFEGSATTSLGLSGGLDSRVLLSILLKKRPRFGIHIFGEPGHPDVQIAMAIATQEHISSERVRSRLPAGSDMFAELKEYIAATNAIAPATAYSKLYGYPQLRENGHVCIDGFFGEIGRRKYYNRLLWRAKSPFESPEAIFPHVQVSRARLFNDEALDVMRSGVMEDLSAIASWHAYSDAPTDEDFADLLAIRYRLPNFSGYEQARLDGLAMTFMPFVQRPFLQSVLETPVRRRKGARLYKRCIQRHYPALAGYPLVSGGTTYPYRFTSLQAWLWTTAKTRLGLAYDDQTRIDFLLSMEEFVRDLVRSSPVRAYSAYAHDEILTAVESFYAGDLSRASFVDWWLAFEIWRAGLACDGSLA